MKVFAQTVTLPDGTVLTGPVPWATSIGTVVAAAVPFVFAFAGMALLLMLIMGGFGMMTGGSDPKKLEGAKKRLTYAIVGFFVMFCSFFIVQIFGTIFGLQSVQVIFGP